MREASIPQIAVITADTSEEFQNLFNSKMQELKHFKPTFAFPSDEKFCAYITYIETEDIPESLSDVFAISGYYYKCKQCPHMVRPKDRRRKYCPCPISPHGQTHMNSPACEIFYEQLRNNAIEPLMEVC